MDKSAVAPPLEVPSLASELSGSNVLFPLRDMRRNYGLSQIGLAELLGVNQSTVSRWERGAEEIDLGRKRQLLDLFSNRKGRFDPLIDRLIRNLPFVTVFGRDRKLLHISEQLARLQRVDQQDIRGRRSRDFIDMTWQRSVFATTRCDEVLMADHVHDLIGHGAFRNRIAHTGVNNRRYRINFDGYPDIVLNVFAPLPRNQAPRLLSIVRISDLDEA